jgi:hypothetical protein
MSDLTISKINPFLKQHRVVVIKNKKTVTSFEEGDINSYSSTTSRTVSYEADPYVKVYTQSKNINIFKRLSTTSCKMYVYIQLSLPKNLDQITMKADEVMAFVGIKSDTTYYTYLQELIDNAIIVSKSGARNVYWVNPYYMFNGDKVKFYKENAPDMLTEITKSNDNHVDGDIKNKKALMEHFKVKSYYQLKVAIGDQQINDVISGVKKLSDVVFLKPVKNPYAEDAVVEHL